jgi:predicted secreted protein
MASRSGREILIIKGGAAIAGLQTTGVSFTAGGVDVTDKMDNGYVTYADFAGTLSFSITADGTAKDAVVRDIFKAGGSFLLTDTVIQWDDAESWACDLWISDYSETGAHNEDVKFSITLNSSGAWTEVV